MPATRASTRSGAPRPKPTKKTPAPAKVKSTTKRNKASRAKPDPVSDEEEDDGPANDTLPEDARTPTKDGPRPSVPLTEDVRHEDATTPTKDAPHRSVPPTKDTPHRSASPAEDLPRRSVSPVEDEPRRSASPVEDEPHRSASSAEDLPRRSASPVEDKPRRSALPVEDEPRRSASSAEDAPSPSKIPLFLPETSPSRETTPDLKEFELEFGLRSKTTPELGDESEDEVGDDGMRLSPGPSHPDNAPSQALPTTSPPRVDTPPASPRVDAPPATPPRVDTPPPPPPLEDTPPPPPPPLPPPPLPPTLPPPPPPPPPPPKHAPPQIVSNPHAPSTEEGDSTLQGGSWAARNPGALQQPVRQRKRVEKPVEDGKEDKRVSEGRKEKGEAEKNTMKEKRKVQAEAKDEYLAAVSDFLAVMEKTAEELADRFDKTSSEVKKALRGLTSLAAERKASLWNAKVWSLAQELNEGRAPGDKYSMKDVQKMVKKDDRYTDMTPEEQEVLLKAFAEAKGVKYSGTRLSNAAACRDVTAFTKRILAELLALQQRTGAIGFLVLGRSSVTDTLNAVCVGPPEAINFLPEVMHTTPDIFSVKFDHYCINREAVGLELSFAQLRKDTVGLIAEGLERKLGKKVPMMCGDYDKLLSNHGVELLGWPAEVEFMNPSALGSMDRLRPLHEALIQGKCRWETMSDARKAEHSAAVKAKVAKEKKPRVDKGMSKAEAKAAKEAKEREKSKLPEGGDENDEGRGDGDGKKRKRVNRKEMTEEELTAHITALNRQKKARYRERVREREGRPAVAPRKKGGKGKVLSREMLDDDDDYNDDADADTSKKAKKRRVASDDSNSDDAHHISKTSKKRRAATKDSDGDDDDDDARPVKKAKKRGAASDSESSSEEDSDDGSAASLKRKGQGRKPDAAKSRRTKESEPAEGDESEPEVDEQGRRILPFAPKTVLYHPHEIADQRKKKQRKERKDLESQLRKDARKAEKEMAARNLRNCKIRAGPAPALNSAPPVDTDATSSYPVRPKPRPTGKAPNAVASSSQLPQSLAVIALLSSDDDEDEHDSLSLPAEGGGASG
ncbi:hypothetical protein DFH09DRAFT_1319178 [Mycena vulgaris]|nr:hypothetical protein DFH09DRAFT_1319178 [Mycena vulgaris]